jgi:H+/Cl- antiporter ClcA
VGFELTGRVNVQPIRFHCPEGQHNDLATSFFSTVDKLLGCMFSVGQDYEGHTQLSVTPGFTIQSLMTFCGLYLAVMALAAGICVPAGLFMPSIVAGASGGLTVGLLLQQHLPPHWHIQPGVCAQSSAHHRSHAAVARALAHTGKCEWRCSHHPPPPCPN